MRRVLIRSSDSRRANTEKPLSPRRSSVPSLLPIPADEYSSARRSSYTGGSQHVAFRSPLILKSSSLRDRFILYGKGINYERVFRVLLVMLVLFTIAVVISLYRLFT